MLPLLLGAVTAAEPPAAPKAFIAKHCLECHNEKQAKSGFRIDQLGTDFSAAKVADHWKEVIDRINTGEMPPKSSPKPSTKEIESFVGWVNDNLKGAEAAAKHAGGRIPMRRLNRDEYANTVRDLLKLDANIVAPLIEDLPGDGKAEGFDRLGVALFFDQTQIERSLNVAEKIAARAIVTEAPKINRQISTFGFLRAKPPGPTIEAFPSSPHQIPRGAEDKFIKPDYIEFIQGGPTYKKELDGWGVIDHFAVAKTVTQDGDYRVRIKAKVDSRGRTEKNMLRLQYGMNSPIHAKKEVEIDPSGITETVIFLRGPANGEVKGPQVFNLLWNHTEKAVIHEPEFVKLFFERTALASKREKAATNKAPQAELDALRKQLDEVIGRLNTWKGPLYIYNPAMDLEKLPRLQITSIEIEGPIQKEWPPPPATRPCSSTATSGRTKPMPTKSSPGSCPAPTVVR